MFPSKNGRHQAGYTVTQKGSKKAMYVALYQACYTAI
jgi:hypothetical protein